MKSRREILARTTNDEEITVELSKEDNYRVMLSLIVGEYDEDDRYFEERNTITLLNREVIWLRDKLNSMVLSEAVNINQKQEIISGPTNV